MKFIIPSIGFILFSLCLFNSHAQQMAKQSPLQLNRKIKDESELRTLVLKEFENFPEAAFGIAFNDIGSGKKIFFNAEDSFHAASTMKTPVMIELFRQSAEGIISMDNPVLIKNEFSSIIDGSKFSLDSTDDSEHELYRMIGQKLMLKELIFLMITRSSNMSTNILIELAGAKNVVATMRALGAKQIQVRRGVEDNKAFEAGLNNRTNAADLMTIFTHLANGSAVNQAASDSMISILMQQHFTERIPGKLPSTVKTATKSGSITKVCHDSGIVFLQDGRKYVIVILTSGIEKEEDAANLIANVSRIFYDYIR